MPASPVVKELFLRICSDKKIRVHHTLKFFGEIHPISIKLSKEQIQDISLLIDMLRENRLYRSEEFKMLGSKLYSVLFDNEIGSLLNKVVFERVADQDSPIEFLKVELTFEEGQEELASWPWEYLFSPSTDFFLTASIKIVLTRYISLPSSIRANSLLVEDGDLPVRILFVAASPDTLPPIPYDRVLESITGLEKQEGTKFKITTLTTSYKEYGKNRSPDYFPQATWEMLSDTIRDFKPHILHFIGHGRYMRTKNHERGELAFMKQDSKARWIQDHELAKLLMDYSPLRLVFLQACESARSNASSPYQEFSGVANHLAKKNIPAVIAMQYKIKIDVANMFAKTFYNALAHAKPIEKAVQEGRIQIQKELDSPNYDFCVPALYLRGNGELISSTAIEADDTSSSEVGRRFTLINDRMQIHTPPEACVWCKQPIEISDKYCTNCGDPLICSECGAYIKKQGKFCVKCGNYLNLKQPPQSPLEKPG